MALAHGVAVAAGAIHLAKVGGEEAVDGDRTQAVVLNDLVRRTLCTAPSDGAISVFLERESVFADSLPPNILDGASALAVNTFNLVSTDNDIS